MSNIDHPVPIHSEMVTGGNGNGHTGTIPVCGPCEEPVADPAIPNSAGICVPRPDLPGCGDHVFPPGGGGIIDNVPICPECPPPKECPKPEACIYIDILEMDCLYFGKSCIYMVLTGYPRLHEKDTYVAKEVACNVDAGNLFQNATKFCNFKLPCKPDKPVGRNGPMPLPGIVCPNPIINFQPPIGGHIINNPIPTNPIDNVPTPGPIVINPPYPYPMPGGTILNVQVVCSPGTDPKTKCSPEGDMAYYSLECNDDSKIKQLWNEMYGFDLNTVFGDKNPMQWWKDFQKDWIKVTVNTIEGILEPISLGGSKE
jgi:hypothetical protein